jgi:ribonuclease Z
MAKLIVLGTSSAVPDSEHENTHLAVLGEERVVLVDCVGNPIVRLRQAGIDISRLSDLILTHFHPDHVSGVPSLLMNMWLLGRQRPLDIYGLGYTLDRVGKMMDLFECKSWPGFYPLNYHPLPEKELTPVLECSDFQVTASPVRHLIPTIGLRVKFHSSAKILAYSCDTEPCAEVVRLAEGADVLFHEATGGYNGHSSPAAAGRVAREAEVGALYLIHYTPSRSDPEQLISEASGAFGGPVALAEDFMELAF